MVRIGILAGAALLGVIPAGALSAQTPQPPASTPASSTTVPQTGATAGTASQPGGWGQGGWQAGSAPAPAALNSQSTASAPGPAWTADSAPLVTTYQPDANTVVTRTERPGPMPAVVGGVMPGYAAGSSVVSATPGRIITTTITRTDYVTSYQGGAVRKAPRRTTRRRTVRKSSCACRA